MMEMDKSVENGVPVLSLMGGGGGGDGGSVGDGGVMLYIRVYRNYVDHWFAIDPDTNHNKFKRLPLKKTVIKGVPPHIKRSSCAAIGSVIYMSGGLDHTKKFDHPPSDQVYYFDTSRSDKGWKQAPSMNSKRWRHYMFADNGKLYVLGGCPRGDPPDADGKRPYSEVYDPATNTPNWEVIVRVRERGPQSMTGHAVLDPDGPGNNKVLFHSYLRKPLYYLHVGYQSVGIYYENFGGCFASAYIGGILYFLPHDRSKNLYAYNVSQPESLPKLVMFREREKCLPCQSWDKTMQSAYLVPLGNRSLALVWSQEYDDVLLRIYCSKLEMSIDSEGFKAELLSHSRYTVRDGTLSCCLAV